MIRKECFRPIATFALAASLCLATNVPATAQETPYWPSERGERLAMVESMIVGTMRRISTAHYYGRDEEAEALLKDLEVLKREQAQLSAPPVDTPSEQ